MKLSYLFTLYKKSVQILNVIVLDGGMRGRELDGMMESMYGVWSPVKNLNAIPGAAKITLVSRLFRDNVIIMVLGLSNAKDWPIKPKI